MDATFFLTEYLYLYLQSDSPSAFSLWLEHFENARDRKDFDQCQLLLRALRQHDLPLWERGKAYQCEGLLLLDQNLLPAAERFLHKALELFRKCDKRQSEAQSLGNLGVLARQQGGWDRAIEYYQQELAFYEDLRLYRSYAEVLYNLALVCEKKGLLDEAETRLNRSLQIFEQVGDLGDRARVLSALGTVFLDRPRRQAALEAYQQAFQLFSEAGEQYQASLVANNLGIVFRQMQRWQEALESYQSSLTIKQDLNDTRGIGTTLNNMGMVHYSAENWLDATTFFERSLTLFEEIGDEYSRAMALYNLARTYYSVGNLECFEQIASQSLCIAGLLQFTDILAELERFRGQACLQRREYATGFEHLERGVDLAAQYGPELLEMVLAHTQQFLFALTDDTAQWSPDLFDPLIIFWDKWQLDTELADLLRKIQRALSRRETESDEDH